MSESELLYCLTKNAEVATDLLHELSPSARDKLATIRAINVRLRAASASGLALEQLYSGIPLPKPGA